jgi:phosphoenolpyruvate carboxylase
MDETLRREVRFLTTRLGAIIREQCPAKTFDAIETLRGLAKQIRQNPDPRLVLSKERVVSDLPLERAAEVAHAFSLFFHLVNLAEERQRVRRLKAYAREDAGAPMSLKRTFNELRRQRIPSPKLVRLLGSMRVAPVLTAHPTEAKRRSVFNQVMRIGRTLDALAGELGPAAERALDPWIEALWLTDEIRERPLTPEVEIESSLVFLERTIYDLAGRFWESLREECRRFDPRLPVPQPFISFGSWVGADRDGNPFITPRTSHAAAESLRQSILGYYQAATRRLLGLLPFPCQPRTVTGRGQRLDIARHLARDLARDLRRFPAAQALTRIDQPSELYRHKVRIMLWRLEETVQRGGCAYADAEEFARDLRLLEETLGARGSRRLAQLGPGRIRVAAQIFSFHAARLDFRQHSSLTRQAARELLEAMRFPAEPEAARVRSIHSLLTQNNPFNRLSQLSFATRRIIAEFNCLREIQARHGERAASPYILSMSSSAADLWDVLLLARAAGLVTRDSGRLRARLDLVPLFETVDDLEAGPQILDELFRDPLYRQVLRSRGNFQEVMLGYSDSVKDSGYLAANVALFRASKRLANLAEKHGVRLGLFHGKGGTIDRGGGQSYQSIRAQPYAAPEGRIRITEQGEVISLKYADPVIAERNLEQLVASVLDAHLLTRPRIKEARLAEWEGALVYETPDFTSYFRQATPIDLIEQLRLGSRPSHRLTGEREFKLEELRAIPWVFAWTQSRQLVPAWYGVGAALEEFASKSGGRGLALLREMYHEWPFFAALLDNAEISLAKTDLYIASRYVSRVRPKRLGEEIFRRIEEEFHRSVRWVLEVSGSAHLLARQPVLAESIRLRNPYVDPLNFLQIRFLNEWRRPPRSAARRRELLHLLQITVSGIAFGMKSTG